MRGEGLVPYREACHLMKLAGGPMAYRNKLVMTGVVFCLACDISMRATIAGGKWAYGMLRNRKHRDNPEVIDTV